MAGRIRSGGPDEATRIICPVLDLQTVIDSVS
jgi:hypothetical protein